MTTLWLTGAGGVVGTKLVEQAVTQGAFDHIVAFSHAPSVQTSSSRVTWAQLDIGDRAAVQAAARLNPPDTIINPAAMTNVDACETKRADAIRANADGPRHLAEVAQSRVAHLLHVSTDYVFPGDAENAGPYAEDATPRPINFYGQTKYDGERNIVGLLEGSTPYAIVRTALVYGFIPGGRTNFVTWLVSELHGGRRVRIVRDQFNTPTLADDLAALLLWMAGARKTGVYHGAGPERVGRHEWALAIAAHFDLDSSLIDWVTTEQLAQVAPRPLQSGLLCERWQADREAGAPASHGIAAGLIDVDWMAGQREE